MVKSYFYCVIILFLIISSCSKKGPDEKRILGLSDFEMLQSNDTVNMDISIANLTDTNVSFLLIGSDYITVTAVPADAVSGKFRITFISSRKNAFPDSAYSILRPGEVIDAKLVCATPNETFEEHFKITIKPHYLFSKNGVYKQRLDCSYNNTTLDNSVKFTVLYDDNDSAGRFELKGIQLVNKRTTINGNFATFKNDNRIFLMTSYDTANQISVFGLGTYSDTLIQLKISTSLCPNITLER